MNKKTILITGATSGIGLETAKELAIRGYKVIMACRNIEKANKIRDEIIETSKNKNVEVMKIDMSSLKSIRNFSQEFHEKYDTLHVLINNAGVFCDTPMKTSEGFEMTMGVNYIGTYYLTKLLLDLLKNAKGARIVNVSSKAGLFGKLKLNKNFLETHPHGFKAYSASKLAVLLVTIEWANELREHHITVNAVHPGNVATGIWKGESFIMKIMEPINKRRYDSPKKGAFTGIYLASEDIVKNSTGQFFEKENQLIKYNKRCLDEKLRRDLVKITEEILEDIINN